MSGRNRRDIFREVEEVEGSMVSLEEGIAGGIDMENEGVANIAGLLTVGYPPLPKKNGILVGFSKVLGGFLKVLGGFSKVLGVYSKVFLVLFFKPTFTKKSYKKTCLIEDILLQVRVMEIGGAGKGNKLIEKVQFQLQVM